MMVYTTGKIGVDLLTDASDSRSSHRGCLRSAPGPPVKNGFGWCELHKMLGYCKILQFQSQNRASIDVEVITSKWFLFNLVFSSDVSGTIHGQNPFSKTITSSMANSWPMPWPDSTMVARRLARWHSCPTPWIMVEHLGRTVRFLHGKTGDRARYFLAMYNGLWHVIIIML